MRRILTTAALSALLAVPVSAQLDPEKRMLLEAGYEQGVGAPGPVSPYAYLYSNTPGVAGKNSVLRAVLAPVYADTELGFNGALPRTALGIGLSGGGFAFGQVEVDRGDERRTESFLGHGGGPSLSFYPRLGSIGPVPLAGVVRGSGTRLSFAKVAGTDPAFVPPVDHWSGALRAGLRLGGQAPGIESGPAAEASTWWETRLRERSGPYGFANDRMMERRTDLYWMRVLVSLPVAGQSRVSGGASLGGGAGVDRISSYRLGGMLDQTAEFPLIIPGYFGQEVFARRYAHAWGRLAAPVRALPSISVLLHAAGATVAPVRGVDSGGVLHAGLGGGLAWIPTGGAYAAELCYGFAPTAVRGGRKGAHSVATTFQVNFLAPVTGAHGAPARQQGLRWLLGRWLTSPFGK